MVGNYFFNYFSCLFFINNFKKVIPLIIIGIPITLYILKPIFSVRNIDSFDQLFEKLHLMATKMARGGSSIEVYDVSTFIGYIYYYLPNLFISIYRPLPQDVTNIFMLLASVENILLIYLSYKFILTKLHVIFKNNHLTLLLIFIFSWSLLYSVLSATNLAAAVRFKLQVLPVILIIVFIVSDIIANRKII